jgi:hypothetical protein
MNARRGAGCVSQQRDRQGAKAGPARCWSERRRVMKIQDAFTPEQQQVLEKFMNLLLGDPSLRTIVDDLNMQLGAIRLALVQKDLVTMDELDEARHEVEAGLMIEQATAPQWKAIAEEWKDLQHGDEEEGR